MTRPRDIADSINRINSSAADATAMTIDSSENVGVGITSSLEKFTVANTSSGIVGRFTNNINQTLDLGITSGSGSAGGAYLNNANSGYIAFQSGTSERLRMLAGGGLTFNGDTAAANALDDYEEGTFTPTYEFSGGGGSFSYSIQVGRYTKIGRFVFVQARIRGQKSGTGSGALQVRNLPFNAPSVTNLFGTGSIAFTNNWVNRPMGAYIETDNRVTLTKGANSSNTYSDLDTTVVNADLGTGSTSSNDLILTVAYTV